MLFSDFARLGQVSVRMLRHYDAVGLLVPDRVDSFTGYRSYAPQQLHVLNRIVALKDLGFGLDQVECLLVEDLDPVTCLLADDLDPAEIRGMLRLRRAQLEDEARTIDTRLIAVETRLRMIEKENTMPADYIVKTIPATRLVAVTATLAPDQLAEHIGPMFDHVAAAFQHGCGALETPIATYAESEAGMDVVGYGNPGPAPEGTAIVDLPRDHRCVRCSPRPHGGHSRLVAGPAPVGHRQRLHLCRALPRTVRPCRDRCPIRLGHRTPTTRHEVIAAPHEVASAT